MKKIIAAAVAITVVAIALVLVDMREKREKPPVTDIPTETSSDVTAGGEQSSAVTDIETLFPWISDTETETETEYFTETDFTTDDEIETDFVTGEDGHVHAWEKTVIKAANCTETGYGHRKCTECGYEEDYEIPITHDYAKKTLVAATCTHYGRGIKTCRICGHSEEYVVNKILHSQVTEIRPDKDGKVYETVVCKNCGTTYVNEITTYVTHIGEEEGITRDKLVAYLKSHENDEYYLGTPYKGHAYAFPNGAPNYSELSKEEQKMAVEAAALYVKANTNGIYVHKTGVPAMNCTGLIGHIMWSVSPSFVTSFNKWISKASYLQFSVAKTTQWDSVTNAWLWFILVTRNPNRTHYQQYDNMGRFLCYKFSTRENLMSSGLLTKGDIVIAVPQYTHGDMHLGIFWGDDPYEDVFWVSEKAGCMLKDMRNPGSSKRMTYWYLLPLANGSWKPDHKETTEPEPPVSDGEETSESLLPDDSDPADGSSSEETSGIVSEPTTEPCVTEPPVTESDPSDAEPTATETDPPETEPSESE